MDNENKKPTVSNPLEHLVMWPILILIMILTAFLLDKLNLEVFFFGILPASGFIVLFYSVGGGILDT